MSPIIIVSVPVRGATHFTPGSRIDKCADCIEEIYVSPTTDQLLKNAGNPRYELICTACIIARKKAGEDFKLPEGPSKAQKEEMKKIGISWTKGMQNFYNLAKIALERKKED